jgi:hypothetical protein
VLFKKQRLGLILLMMLGNEVIDLLLPQSKMIEWMIGKKYV